MPKVYTKPERLERPVALQMVQNNQYSIVRMVYADTGEMVLGGNLMWFDGEGILHLAPHINKEAAKAAGVQLDHDRYLVFREAHKETP